MHKEIQEYIQDAYGLKAVCDTVAYGAVKATYWEARGREISDEGIALRELFKISRNECVNGIWPDKQPIHGDYWDKKVKDAITYYDTEREVKDDDAVIVDIKKAFEDSGVADLISHAKLQLSQMRTPYAEFSEDIIKKLTQDVPVFDWDDVWQVCSAPTKLKIMLAIGESLAMSCAVTSQAQLKYLQAFNQNAFGKMTKAADDLKLLREDVKEFHDTNLNEIGDAVVKGYFPEFELERLARFLAV